VLTQVRQKLQASRKLDAYQVLLLTIVILLEHLLKSSDSFSPSRQIMMAILVEVVTYAPAALVPEKEAQRLNLYLRRLNGLSNLAKEATQACDTAFLYYHTHILPALVQGIYQVPTEANRLQYVLSAFEDGIRCVSLSFVLAFLRWHYCARITSVNCIVVTVHFASATVSAIPIRALTVLTVQLLCFCF
jgi:hypothetical protein